MTIPRVVVTRRWPGKVEQRFTERFEVVLNQSDCPPRQDELAAAMAEFDVLCPTFADRIDEAVIGAGDRVKLIANYGVGFDNIDVAAARAKEIVVTNTPGVLTDATAELALTLMLMTARRASEGERELRAGKWTGGRPTYLLGSSLMGKTLGLVGFGRIGQATARRAKYGFGMRIAYHARREADSATIQGFEADFHPGLNALLAASDFVSLHAPGGAETENMIDAAALKAVRPSAYLINTARGTAVDYAALAAALRTRRLAGAGLDVYPHEPEVPADLLELENAVLLPHLGSATRETHEAMGMRALAKAEAWAFGQPIPDRVA